MSYTPQYIANRIEDSDSLGWKLKEFDGTNAKPHAVKNYDSPQAAAKGFLALANELVSLRNGHTYILYLTEKENTPDSKLISYEFVSMASDRPAQPVAGLGEINALKATFESELRSLKEQLAESKKSEGDKELKFNIADMEKNITEKITLRFYKEELAKREKELDQREADLNTRTESILGQVKAVALPFLADPTVMTGFGAFAGALLARVVGQREVPGPSSVETTPNQSGQ